MDDRLTRGRKSGIVAASSEQGNPAIKIRDAKRADGHTIADFNSRLAAETEARVLDPNRIGPGVNAVLGDPAKGRYWVAEEGQQVIGQIMVTYEWSDWRNGMIWWIQSVYVDPEHRRSGVFSALYRHVELLAKSAPDVCGLRLYVESGNTRAQATYKSLGMAETGYRVLEAMFTNESADQGVS